MSIPRSWRWRSASSSGGSLTGLPGSRAEAHRNAAEDRRRPSRGSGRCGGAAHPEADGAGDLRGVGRPDQPHHQHQHRVLARARKHLVAQLCRPPYGVPDGASRGRTRNRAAAEPVAGQRRGRCRPGRGASRLGDTAHPPARAAVRSRTLADLGAADGNAVSLPEAGRGGYSG